MHGTVYSARFAPDGHNVIYSASWDGTPVEIFSTDLKSTGTRKMELPATHLLAGGSPRQIAEKVEWADWAPHGKTLAIVRDMGGKRRLEFPLAHVLYQTAGWIGHPRISPKGYTIAFLDHPTQADDQGVVSLVDLAGRKRVLSTGWESEEGLAWSPAGTEVWFSATEAGLERRIYAVNLSGRQRLAYRALGGVTLQDIAPTAESA